jgi:hypothetical protein
MRLVVSLLTAVCFIAGAEASATGVATPQSCAFGPAAHHHRHHQRPVAASSEAGRQLHDHMSVDGRQQFCNTHCF